MQSPPEVKKNPGAHWAQAVPLLAVVHPALQEHWPFEPQTPFKQLHVELVAAGTRQSPLPEMPSSQLWHPAGHAWQFGPKKPWAQDSHDVPVKPGGHVHVPEEEHTPAPAQGGEHAEDWMSRMDMLLSEEPAGSCDKSATESQMIRRSPDEGPEETAAQTFDEIISELAVDDVESRVALLDGRAEKVEGPE